MDSTFLKRITTIKVGAVARFTAAVFFKEDKQPNGIKLWLPTKFKEHFINCSGTTKTDVPAATLNVYEVNDVVMDIQILVALGGNDAAKTDLAHVAQLIKAQANGEEGVLLTNERANIFYVEDNEGKLWAVYCYWDCSCNEWNIYDRSVSDPDTWIDGNNVFSSAVLTP